MKLKINIIILLVIIFVFSIFSAKAETRKLSKYSRISLITCAPGSELYSVFGHSAVFVSDPARGINSVYNYGTFDFYQKGFYLKFVRGKLNYRLAKSSYSNFINNYVEENRKLSKQIINL